MERLAGVDEHIAMFRKRIKRPLRLDHGPSIVTARAIQRANLQICVGGGAGVGEVLRLVWHIGKTINPRQRCQIRMEVLVVEWDHVDWRRQRQVRSIEQTRIQMRLGCRNEIDRRRLEVVEAVARGILRFRRRDLVWVVNMRLDMLLKVPIGRHHGSGSGMDMVVVVLLVGRWDGFEAVTAGLKVR